MSITVVVSPTIEQTMREEANRRGVAIETLVRELIERTYQTMSLINKRPYGLAAGEFTVPTDFNAPLPDDVLDLFQGK